MDTLDQQILIALLGTQPSIYVLKETLKDTSYTTVLRRIKKMQKEGLIITNKVKRKDGKLDKRNTKKLKLTPKGYAKLLIEGDLNEKELKKSATKILQRDYSDLFLPKLLKESNIDKIYAGTLLKTRYKINLQFFDEEYFYEVFFISFAESFFENIKEINPSEKITNKRRAKKLKKKYVLPVIEDLKKIQQLYKFESKKFNHYSKAIGEIIQAITK